ncbi:hypothetical protein ABZ922_35750 [Streptomyces shenzhenensis]|uniref:hypothetical protein n=1 Tax=Streptomyces shenzhenensis TaxID=943815 RepID=UPI0033E189C7
MLTTLAPDTELAPAGRTIRAGDKVVVRHVSADRDAPVPAGWTSPVRPARDGPRIRPGAPVSNLVSGPKWPPLQPL